MLLCSDNTYYVGVTNNLNRRLYEHNSNLIGNTYTSKRLPVKLVWNSRHNYIFEAILLEKQLKGWSKKKKRAMVEGNWELVKIYSECKNSSNSKLMIKV